MNRNLSNHIKATIYLGDLTEGLPIRQDDCFTVTSFDYQYFRARSKDGTPCGRTQDSHIVITIKSQPDGGTKELYQRLKDNDIYSYSLIFNATYDSSRIVASYENCMVSYGYIVSIEEEFESPLLTGADTERMSMTIKIVLHSTTYVGEQNNKTVKFV